MIYDLQGVTLIVHISVLKDISMSVVRVISIFCILVLISVCQGRFWWSLLVGVDWWDAVGCTQSAAEDGIGKNI